MIKLWEPVADLFPKDWLKQRRHPEFGSTTREWTDPGIEDYEEHETLAEA